MFLNKKPENIRSFIFGVEDSLVSTVGLISGIAIAGMSHSIIILTGTILVFVEAFSMAVGVLLSDNSVREVRKHSIVALKSSFQSSIIMFVSYIFAGFVVLLPYIIFSGNRAFIISILLSLITLFILGIISAKFSETSILRKGLVMVSIGGVAIFIGIIVSNLVSKFA